MTLNMGGVSACWAPNKWVRRALMGLRNTG